MKTSTVLTVGIGAGLIALALKKVKAEQPGSTLTSFEPVAAVPEVSEDIADTATQTVQAETQNAKDKLSKKTTDEITKNLQTLVNNTKSSKSRVEAGVKLINQATHAGVGLPTFTKVLARDVTAKNIKTGETERGNIIQLPSGTKKLISVRPVN